jgi:hypothetical protein
MVHIAQEASGQRWQCLAMQRQLTPCTLHSPTRSLASYLGLAAHGLA